LIEKLEQRQSNNSASHKTSMTGELASPIPLPHGRLVSTRYV
jgi:hypothetical protein